MTRKLAKIESTFLGYEDHGILTAFLQVSYGGSGQGIGGYGLDEYDEDSGRRIGTAYGCEWISRVLRACGVDSWEELKGRTIYVLFEDDSTWQGRPQGIENLPTERGETFLFADIKHMAEESVPA